MITFEPDTDNRTTRRRIVVPDQVKDVLERTLRDGTVGELPYEQQADADALVRLMTTHANRRNLRLHTECVTKDGTNVLRFKMRKRRVYTKRSPVWQQPDRSRASA